MPTYHLKQPLQLESGRTLASCQVAYQIEGTPSQDGSNVVVACHTLSGGIDIVSSRVWWFVGPGQLIDTNHYCVISMATLGSWYGSSSPFQASDPSQQQTGLDFPTITVTDSINAHRQVLQDLGITHARALIGGSFGGFCAYTWLALEPELFDVAFIFQSALRCSAHTIAFFALARDLICSDPAWLNGHYHRQNINAMAGVKRMLGLNRLLQFSHATFERKFPPDQRFSENGLEVPFSEPWTPVDEFILSEPKSLQGLNPTDFLCLIRSSALFDLERTFPDLWTRWQNLRTELVQIPCAQDWRYPTTGMEQIHVMAKSVGLKSHLLVTHSDYGHGSFLHDPPSLKPVLPLLGRLLSAT